MLKLQSLTLSAVVVGMKFEIFLIGGIFYFSLTPDYFAHTASQHKLYSYTTGFKTNQRQ